jgi:hypothetical protein
MMTITIEEEELMVALKQAAQNQATTVEAIVKQALQWHLPSLPSTEDTEPAPPPLDAAALRKKYPFIGIWQTGKSDLSEQTEDILAREMGQGRVD